MRIAAAIFTLMLAIVCHAAELDSATIIAQVRTIIAAPDQWSDMTVALDKLDSLAVRSKEKEKSAIETFRKRFAEYRGYFVGHAFSLTPKERETLLLAVHAYEERFTTEQKRIMALWREDPKEDHGCLAAAELARFQAEFELDKCAPPFVKHSWAKSRPNELAAVFMDVMRDYGRLMVDLAEDRTAFR